MDDHLSDMSGARSFDLPSLYPLITATAVSAFGLTVWSGPAFTRPAGVISLGLAIGAFVYEFRRDPVTATRVAFILALFVAIFGGAAFLAGAVSGENRVLGAAALAIPALILFALFARMQWGPEPLPNLVRKRFGARAGEGRGVQIGVAIPATIRPGEVGWLEVLLQNTWNAPRVVTVRVGGTGAWRARFQESTELSLGALEIVTLRLPLVVDEAEVPTVRLAVDLWVRGRGGQRRRLWRAPREAHRRRFVQGGERAEGQYGRPGGLVIALPVAVKASTTGTAAEPVVLPASQVDVTWSPARSGTPRMC